MSYMPETWKGELILFARLLQKELGKLPCAFVKYTVPGPASPIADRRKVRSQICPQIWLYAPFYLHPSFN